MDSNKQGATTAKPLRSISMSVLAATRTRSGALSFFSLFGGGGSTPGSSNVTEVSSSGCRGDQDGSQWVKATLCLTDTKLCYDIVGQVSVQYQCIYMHTVPHAGCIQVDGKHDYGRDGTSTKSKEINALRCRTLAVLQYACTIVWTFLSLSILITFVPRVTAAWSTWLC